MDNVHLMKEVGEVSVDTIARKPGFVAKTSEELARRLSPHNVAAAGVVLALTSVGSIAGAFVWKKTVGERFVDPWMEGRRQKKRDEELKEFMNRRYTMPHIEALVTRNGWAKTELEAKALVFSYLERHNQPIPERYREFVPEAPPAVMKPPVSVEPPPHH